MKKTPYLTRIIFHLPHSQPLNQAHDLIKSSIRQDHTCSIYTSTGIHCNEKTSISHTMHIDNALSLHIHRRRKCKLASEEEALTCTIPRGAFREIDRQTIDCASYAEQGQASSALKEKCEFSLSRICTHEQYEHFKAFWETDLAALPAEDEVLSQYQADLTPDLFDSFLFTAAFLEIQGEYAKRFAKNMVRYGLLGKHSKDITENSQCKEKDLAYDTFEAMLPVFLSQAGFDSRTIMHPSKKEKALLIEKAGERPKQINKEYTGPPQTTRMRTVLHTEHGPAHSQEKERNEAVLAWLLLNTGGSSVDIQYTITVFSNNTTALSQAIEQFTKENKKDGWVHVEGLSLKVDCRNNISLRPALQLVPGLSRLGLSTNGVYRTSKEAPSSLISDISSCKALKVLEIAGYSLENAEISTLMESLPNIEQLSLICKRFKYSAINSLKKCSCLERLKIEGKIQGTLVVYAILRHLPSLRELSIWANALDLAASEAFQTCKKLKKLKMWGVCQSSAVVQALLRRLPSLKHLNIETDREYFALADALQKCPNLRSLNLSALQYTPGFLARYLQNPLPRLKSLNLHNRDRNHRYSEEDVKAVKDARAKGMSICAF